MNGIFVASYLILWGCIVVLGLMVVGMLRQIGLLQRAVGQHAAESDGEMPSLEQDGPPLGAELPQLTIETFNGWGSQMLTGDTSDARRVLILFISPLCETCQHIVDPLNALADEHPDDLRILAIIRADEQACEAFLSVFPLHVPVVCDSTRRITMGFDVHRNPLGLLYGPQGTLLRKGVIAADEDLTALLHEGPLPVAAQTHIIPAAALTVAAAPGAAVADALTRS